MAVKPPRHPLVVLHPAEAESRRLLPYRVVVYVDDVAADDDDTYVVGMGTISFFSVDE